MRFMVMHKVDAQMEAGAAPNQRIIKEMGELVQGSLKSGVFEDGAGLHPSSQRVRVTFESGKAGGRTVTRGPLTGGNELLASFAMIKAASIDAAVDVAARIAAVAGDGEIEIGPVVEPWDLGLMAKPAAAPRRFLLLRKADAAFEAGAPQPPAMRKLLDELKHDDVVQSARTLTPSLQGARSRKVAGKRAWTDGPFAESKELIAGFSLLKLPSLADAKAWAERYAEVLGDNEVDVRVIVEG
jgi:hypothetical protein